GADGLLASDGLHRVAAPASDGTSIIDSDHANTASVEGGQAADADTLPSDDPGISEPVLTSDELRALLHEQPTIPPNNNLD
ncbi:MAG: hypothetical protein ACREJC_13085, partial [Tepidisphaeraceae bacterium]